MQKINFIENLEVNATMFFILEKVKETIFDFLRRTVGEL